MSNKNSQYKTGLVASGILVLTGFTSLTTQSGLMSKLANSLDRYLIPVAEAKFTPSQSVAISEQQLIQELGADAFVIEGKAAFVVSQAGEKKVAPNGYYQLSNGSIIKVKDGDVYQATLKPTTGEKIAGVLICDVKGSWMRCNQNLIEEIQPDVASANSQKETIRVSVRDTLNKIMGA